MARLRGVRLMWRRDVRFTCRGADPTCATEEQLPNLLRRLHEHQALLYPVTGFLQSEDEQPLRYRPMEATYRLRPHLDGSRASAVRVAESKHIADINAAHQLWVTCVIEDCFAYLAQQMNLYSLWPEEEEALSTKRLVASYVPQHATIRRTQVIEHRYPGNQPEVHLR